MGEGQHMKGLEPGINYLLTDRKKLTAYKLATRKQTADKVPTTNVTTNILSDAFVRSILLRTFVRKIVPYARTVRNVPTTRMSSAITKRRTLYAGGNLSFSHRCPMNVRNAMIAPPFIVSSARRAA